MKIRELAARTVTERWHLGSWQKCLNNRDRSLFKNELTETVAAETRSAQFNSDGITAMRGEVNMGSYP